MKQKKTSAVKMKSNMAACLGPGYQSIPPIGRTVDRVFEDAQFTGEIYLNGRKLRDYPKLYSKYDLSDTVLIDISRNRLAEVPHEVCECLYVERVNCYHNVIRTIPDAIQQLQNLTHLNLSRNQLSVFPPALCLLSCLEVLHASNNKLVSLPEEIGELKSLMDLDVSCNELSHLPLQIGDLSALRCLNLRRNYIVELPVEISRLQLFRLDFSSNRIEKIPTVFRKIETLEQLILDHNPLSSPSAHTCIKGRQHIMKYLQIQAVKDDRKRGVLINADSDMKRVVRKSLPPQQSAEELKSTLGTGESKWKRHTVLSTTDSGYSTTDGIERNGWHSGEELASQRMEYERQQKQELIRVQQEEEEEREKEERRAAALKLQEEQRLLLEREEGLRRRDELKKQELVRQEEFRIQDERRKEDEESWRREEEIKRMEETVIMQGEMETKQLSDINRTEPSPTEKSSISNSYHQHTNTSSQNSNRPQYPPPVPPTSSSSSSRLPQPPSSLPVHGFLWPMSPSSSLSSTSMSSSTSSSSYHMSPQQQQEDNNYILSENDYRNALSSQSLKEQRRLANSTQYRGTTSGMLKKPGQPTNPQSHVDNLNYVNRNGIAEVSQQSSNLTTPTESSGPSLKISVSHLAKPNSPSGSTSHLAKPSSPSGSSSHIAKPTGTKSSVPRATNGPVPSAQSQAVRRAKLASDRSNASSPVTARPAKTGASLVTHGSTLSLASSGLRRSSNSSATDEDSKPKKGLPTPTDTTRSKSKLEELNKKGPSPSSGLKQVHKSAPQDGADTNKRISMRPPTNSYGSGRGRAGGPKAAEDPTSNLTMKRRDEQHREETEQIERLRQTVESRLRVTLPDNVAEALRDGVVLCHLANQIRPRSVGSIHVPSPAVPKLTLAKCRRNVDNFLDACRKIGVDQAVLCDPDDIIEGLRLVPVAETVERLMQFPRLEPTDFYTEQMCGPQDILEEKGVLRVSATVAALVVMGANPKQSTV